MSTRFLVPLDGSHLAEEALSRARVLAEKTQKKVELLRCYESLDPINLFPSIFAPPPMFSDESPAQKDRHQSLQRDIQEYLEAQARKFDEGVATPLAVQGDAAGTILERSKSGEIEWIVMSSHGYGGLGRWLLGSVASKIVRASHVPVLVSKAGAKNTWNPGPKSILVCLDGSDLANSAIPYAVKLARDFESSMTLFQSVSYTPLRHPDLKPIVSIELSKSEEFLETVRDRYQDLSINVVSKAIRPEDGILEQAKHSDLIVMSSHGRTGLKRWLLGSVAERIVQRSPCPVLVIHPKRTKPVS